MQRLSAFQQPIPATEDGWRDLAKGFLKAELKRQNLTYADLAERLVAIGVEETEASIRNKVNRGSFTFTFALQSFAAIGVDVRVARIGTVSVELSPDLLSQSIPTFKTSE